MRCRRRFHVAALVGSALVLAACGQDADAPAADDAPAGGETAAPGETAGGDCAIGADESWPDALTIYVPAPAGGGFDIVVRLLQPILSEELGNDIVVVNMPGAGGAVAGQQMLSEPADGTRMEIVSRSAMSVPYTGTPEFDPLTVLQPVGVAAQDVSAVTVRADAPWNSLQEFLDAAGESPGEIQVGTSGIGGVWHAAGLRLARAADVEFTFIPYAGGSDAANALVAGEIDAITTGAPEVQSIVDAGEAKVLAVMGEEPSSLYPDVPTLEEEGIDVTYAVWRGFVVDEETPDCIVAELENRVEAAVTSPEYEEAAANAGFEVFWATSEEFRQFMEEEDELVRELFEGEDFMMTEPERVSGG